MCLIICHCSTTDMKHLVLICLNCRQEIPAIPGQPHKEPMLILLAIGLLDKQAQNMVLTSVYNGKSLLSFIWLYSKALKRCKRLVKEKTMWFKGTYSGKYPCWRSRMTKLRYSWSVTCNSQSLSFQSWVAKHKQSISSELWAEGNLNT